MGGEDCGWSKQIFELLVNSVNQSGFTGFIEFN